MDKKEENKAKESLCGYWGRGGLERVHHIILGSGVSATQISTWYNENMVQTKIRQEMDIYHERQKQMLCLVHTLNNLFQDRNAYSKANLDAISYQLSPDAFVNPHKNMLGLGNYDVSVLMAALQWREYEAVWFDKRLWVIRLMNGFNINIV